MNSDLFRFGGRCGYVLLDPMDTASGGAILSADAPILFGYRWYAPWLGRDPIDYDGGPNLYEYCAGDPINNLDPSGLDWLDNASNFFAGWGDGLTFGATGRIRQWIGVDSVVNRDSGWYAGGHFVGEVHQGAPFNGGVAAKLASRARVFKSFARLKTVMGPAGKGMNWHHIVEQCHVERFGADAIHNTRNVIRLDAKLHTRLSAFYSSKKPWLTGSDALTVRQWVSKMSYKEQYAFGLKAIRMIEKGAWR